MNVVEVLGTPPRLPDRRRRRWYRMLNRLGTSGEPVQMALVVRDLNGARPLSPALDRMFSAYRSKLVPIVAVEEGVSPEAAGSMIDRLLDR